MMRAPKIELSMYEGTQFHVGRCSKDGYVLCQMSKLKHQSLIRYRHECRCLHAPKSFRSGCSKLTTDRIMLISSMMLRHDEALNSTVPLPRICDGCQANICAAYLSICTLNGRVILRMFLHRKISYYYCM